MGRVWKYAKQYRRAILYAVAAVVCALEGRDEWMVFAGAAVTDVSPDAGAVADALLRRKPR